MIEGSGGPVLVGAELKMNSRTQRILTALSGISGQCALGVYYSGVLVPNAILRGTTTTSSLMMLVASHRTAIMVDAWLQCVGALLSAIFFLALVHRASAAQRFAGRLVAVMSSVMVALAVLDATFVVAAANAASVGHDATIAVAFDFVAGAAEAFDYAFLFVPAPALILSLGVVLLDADVLPTVFGWIAVAIGVAFVGVGVSALVSPLSGSAGTAFLAVQFIQVLWIMAVALVLLVWSDVPARRVQPTKS
jgi:hypothetical protein